MRQHMVQYGKANRSSVLELLLSFFAEYAAAIRKWSEDRNNGSRQAARQICLVCILPACDVSEPKKCMRASPLGGLAQASPGACLE